ncbi:beta-ketoacyl-ACP synthase II [Caldinitratiruptor microaerophilus]|uniref:3-oxoacyl-[acyl-carrier-protein] synthase 2 n=1 Tax=Caldinitratiruptor microaerophilus TaxID=671077 RepID=A0AA35CNL8_9FIRM|nr:beta-ketoacyl-ACP synthase II [Caldinitratiruptor microaerophilus]BDG60610.1 3-oxoacyl-[acyl-carrier-protein] synthase 2 [Caldinitratiruptor microaerophilus]
MRNRVVITGMGAVTPLGTGVEAFREGLFSGRSGVGPITRFDASGLETRIGAEVRDFNPLDFIDRKEARRMDRFVQFAIAAAQMALADAGLDLDHVDRDRAGVYMGSGIGGMETLSEQFAVLFEKGPGRVSPFLIPMMIANMAAGQLAIQFGLRGPNMTTVTACSSSNHAIGEAFHALREGKADVMLAGGSEAAFVPIALAGFSSMKALSTRNDEPERASRPFDRLRDGFVMGEGAGILVLETLDHAQRRGARILAEVLGYGTSADAHHIVQPPDSGEGGARSMRLALEDAGLVPEQVDYINAHGTSTPQGDVAETRAIKSVFGEHARRLAVSSTKSMHGHLLGAAGAVELIACVLAIRDQVLPPTINQEEPDPECDLDYVPNRARPGRVDVALSNSFGFGGQNATVIVGRFREGAADPPR